MLSDEFFKAYMETNDSKAPAPAHEEIPVKDSYSRAEVEEIVAQKIAEALEAIKTPVEQVETPTGANPVETVEE